MGYTLTENVTYSPYPVGNSVRFSTLEEVAAIILWDWPETDTPAPTTTELANLLVDVETCPIPHPTDDTKFWTIAKR